MRLITLAPKLTAALLLSLSIISAAIADEAELESWSNDATSKRALLTFVSQVTDERSPQYVPPEARIAVFDNDGTLWAEQPVYFQLLFAIDQARMMLKEQPALASESPYREIASGDLKAIAAGGQETLLKLMMQTHTGMTQTAFADAVRDWIATAKHPTTGRRYTEMVYQPMLELLDYLRANDFDVWIVSGGGVDFMRVWAEDVYGIPPENIVGSRLGLKYVNGELLREAKIEHINDKSGKPVGISQQIGHKPIMAVGNSDGDFAMLEWVTGQPGPSLGVLVHHTDADDEWAYDRDSHIGQLVRGLDEAAERGWILVNMKKDWRTVFASN